MKKYNYDFQYVKEDIKVYTKKKHTHTKKH